MKNTLKILMIFSLAVACSLPAFAGPAPLAAQAQQGTSAPAAKAATKPAGPPPLTLQEVLHMFKKNKKHLERILPEIQKRGVDFEMTAAIQKQFLKEGAKPDFMRDLEQAGPTARQMAAAGVTPQEVEALKRINNELDPDRKIQMVEDFAKQYPKSKELTYAYFLAEGAYYIQKHDITNALKYGALSLKANPDDLNALMLTAALLPLPASVSNDPNPEVKLKQAEADANKALEMIAKLTKASSETEEAFETRKAGYTARMHGALGMVHLERATQALQGVDPDELAKSANEYKLAIAASKTPNVEYYYRLGDVYRLEKKNQDAIQAYSKVVELSDAYPQLKSMAQDQITKLKAAH